MRPEREFEEKVIDGAKIEEIARRAHISKQIVYHYVASKEELYWEIAKRVTINCYTGLLDTDYWALEPMDAISAFIRNAFRLYGQSRLLTALTEDQSFHKAGQLRENSTIQALRRRLASQIDDDLTGCKKGGVVRTDITFVTLDFLWRHW